MKAWDNLFTGSNGPMPLDVNHLCICARLESPLCNWWTGHPMLALGLQRPLQPHSEWLGLTHHYTSTPSRWRAGCRMVGFTRDQTAVIPKQSLSKWSPPSIIIVLQQTGNTLRPIGQCQPQKSSGSLSRTNLTLASPRNCSPIGQGQSGQTQNGPPS